MSADFDRNADSRFEGVGKIGERYLESRISFTCKFNGSLSQSFKLSASELLPMVKGGRRRRERGNLESVESENLEENDEHVASGTAYADLSFVEKREYQRRVAANKRRSKMKVNIAG